VQQVPPGRCRMWTDEGSCRLPQLRCSQTYRQRGKILTAAVCDPRIGSSIAYHPPGGDWSPAVYIGEQTMIRVFVDKNEVLGLETDEGSIDELIRRLEAEVLPPETVIRQIHVDGVPVLLNDADRASEILRSGVKGRGSVEVSTATVEELASDSIVEALEYLSRIETLAPGLAAGFQSTPGPETFESLRQFYEGFYWINLLIERLESTFQIGLESIVLDGVSAPDQHKHFLEVLKELVDAQERQDFLLLADLLEYEVLPVIPFWRKIFTTIAGRLGNRN